MRFLYYYKTADGMRRTGEVSAESKDEAFSDLRQKGIRPIKLVDVDAGQNVKAARKWEFSLVLLCVVIVASSVAFVVSNRISSGQQLEVDAPENESAELQAQCQTILSNLENNLSRLDFDMLSNYALIEKTEDVSTFYAIIPAIQKEIENSREQVKPLLRGKSGQSQSVQKLVGQIDAIEWRMTSLGYAFVLLDENRGKWHSQLQGGKRVVVWSDLDLKRKFRFYTRSL